MMHECLSISDVAAWSGGDNFLPLYILPGGSIHHETPNLLIAY